MRFNHASHQYQTPLEQKVDKVINPFQQFIQRQSTASYFLLVSILIALLFATFPHTTHHYIKFIELELGLNIGSLNFNNNLTFFVNDILLTIFFFFVGLEIKREFLVGELTDRKRETLIILAAIGGMIFPSIIFYSINYGTETSIGWGIPIGTDTAFALGILYLFQNRLPKGILTFMAGLAIIDDIIAILVIALFYTKNLQAIYLVYAIPVVISIMLLNYSGAKKPLAYVVLGGLLWFFVESAEVHGTLAGIVTAFLIPARPKKAPENFIEKTKKLLDYFEQRQDKNFHVLQDATQHLLLKKVEEIAAQTSTPLQRWESKLQLPVTIIILPLFALVNSGIPLNLRLLSSVFLNNVSLGIFFALVIGKPLGILLFSTIALKTKIGKLPNNLTLKNLVVPALLAGIGFTMSLFIANLCFNNNPEILTLCKIAILISSAVSASLAMTMIKAMEVKSNMVYRAA